MKKEISELLRELPLFLTRAGWTYHPPTYDENGRFRYGFPEYDAFIEICHVANIVDEEKNVSFLYRITLLIGTGKIVAVFSDFIC